MQSPEQIQLQSDAEHLNLLKIFHYVLGGMSAAFSCLFIFHLSIGWNMVYNRALFGSSQNTSTLEAGWLLMLTGLSALLIGWSYAALQFYAGKCLAARRKRGLIFVTAAFNCCNMPLGVILGILTIIVMIRPSVKDLFAQTTLPLQAGVKENYVTAGFADIPDPDEDMWQELEKKSRSEQAQKARADFVGTNRLSAGTEMETRVQEGEAEIIQLNKPVFQPEKERGT